MPYGVDKSLGGDNKENDAWMEKCVAKVKGSKGKDGKPIDEGGAIAICKATLKKHKESNKPQANSNIHITVEDL